MLIITAKNNSLWEHKTDFEDKMYGALLRKAILREVQTCYVSRDVLSLCC